MGPKDKEVRVSIHLGYQSLVEAVSRGHYFWHFLPAACILPDSHGRCWQFQVGTECTQIVRTEGIWVQH